SDAGAATTGDGWGVIERGTGAAIIGAAPICEAATSLRDCEAGLSAIRPDVVGFVAAGRLAFAWPGSFFPRRFVPSVGLPMGALSQPQCVRCNSQPQHRQRQKKSHGSENRG